MPKGLLNCNDAFYRAIRRGDYAQMDSLWARVRRVTCTHPGWTLLTGRDAVMDSWRMIITEQDPPQIWPVEPLAVCTGQTGFVVCTEMLDGLKLSACNAFTLEAGAWRLINHQAAQIPMEQAG